MPIKHFWQDLLPIDPSNISFENKSIDVVLKGCFDHYNVTACVRSSLLTFLGFITFFFCLIRILKLHALHHPQIHQYLVFYLAILEIASLVVKWMATMGWYQLEFVASYSKMVQFILLCHFHWSLVARILHQEKLVNWIIMSLLGVFLTFFSLITGFAVFTHFSSWVECLAPHWIVLSFAEFLCIQLYVIAGIYITRKINSISAMDSFKWEQKRDLWSVIVTYEFSSVITLSYYSTLQALGNEERGCSGIFEDTQEIFSPVYATFMIIKYLCPIWVMLQRFHPTRGVMSSEDQRLLGWSFDGSTTSTFNPGPRFQDSYRNLIWPVQSGSFGANADYPTLRRSASFPNSLSKSPLTAIRENTALSPAYVPNYGAVDSFSSQPDPTEHNPRKTRSRHDSGMPKKTTKKKYKVVSLNQSSGEMENVLPSSSSVEHA